MAEPTVGGAVGVNPAGGLGARVQHAVHERIALTNNIYMYINKQQETLVINVALFATGGGGISCFNV